MCDWFTNFPVFSTGRSYLQKMTLCYQHTHMVCATSYILGRLMVYSSLGPRSDIRAGWGLGTRLGLQQQFIEIAQSLITVKRVVAHNIGGWLLSENSFVSFSARLIIMHTVAKAWIWSWSNKHVVWWKPWVKMVVLPQSVKFLFWWLCRV